MSTNKNPTDRLKLTPELHQETKKRAVISSKTIPEFQKYLLLLDEKLPEIRKMLSTAIENTKCIDTATKLDEVREKLNNLISGDK